MFTKGQKIFSSDYGWGFIVRTNADNNDQPVEAKFVSGLARYFTVDGRINNKCAHQNIFNEEKGKLLELVLNYNPAPIKVGDEGYGIKNGFGKISKYEGCHGYTFELNGDKSFETFLENGSHHYHNPHYLLSKQAGKIVELLQTIQQDQGYQLEDKIKVGDWVVITEPLSMYNNRVVKVIDVLEEGINITLITFKQANGWWYGVNSYRKATKEEIPCC